jgi:hypothetical protein
MPLVSVIAAWNAAHNRPTIEAKHLYIKFIEEREYISVSKLRELDTPVTQCTLS